VFGLTPRAGETHAFVTSSTGAFIDLGMGSGYGINQLGQVTGSSGLYAFNSRAFITDIIGVKTDLGGFNTGNTSAGYSI
jgi:hypothetical protein